MALVSQCSGLDTRVSTRCAQRLCFGLCVLPLTPGCPQHEDGMLLQAIAVYLACEEDSSYVTAAIMNVTGGMIIG